MQIATRRNEMDRWFLGTQFLICLLFVVIIGGCAGHKKNQPLELRVDADTEAAAYILEGNHFFAGKRYRDAAMKYEAAIKVQSTLGEAHYNLGLALYRRGLYAEARPHFKKAAHLEPFNQVIRNAPPFRKYGTPKPKAKEEPRDDYGHETD
jgi:tetratricopeptide (TPR) repeat protein